MEKDMLAKYQALGKRRDKLINLISSLEARLEETNDEYYELKRRLYPTPKRRELGGGKIVFRPYKKLQRVDPNNL